MKKELNKIVASSGIQFVTLSRPIVYGEYAPYRFIDSEEELKRLY